MLEMALFLAFACPCRRFPGQKAPWRLGKFSLRWSVLSRGGSSLVSSPCKNSHLSSSRRKEAQDPGEIDAQLEPPHVGCYYLNGLFGSAERGARWKINPEKAVQPRMGMDGRGFTESLAADGLPVVPYDTGFARNIRKALSLAG